MVISKEDLKNKDIDGLRMLIDRVCFDVRGILSQHKTPNEEQIDPAVAVEKLIDALDFCDYAMLVHSHLERDDKNHPVINGMVLSLRYLTRQARLWLKKFKTSISAERYEVLLDHIELLDEGLDDTEHIFFVIPHNKELMAALNALLWAK